MPLSFERPARWRTLLPWIIGSVPLLCGLLVTHWQIGHELQARSQATARQTVSHLDGILDGLAGAAQALLPMAGRPCSEATLMLHRQVTRNAFVRSTNLFDDDQLYCTSLEGDTSEAVDPRNYVDGRLWLMTGNRVTPGRPLLVYRTVQQKRGVLVAVDGEHLTTALRLIGNEEALYLQVGEHWMGQDGTVHGGQAPTAASAPATVYSTRYPLSVHAGFAAGKRVEQLGSQYPALLCLLLVIGVIAGLACRWQLRRASSSRAELNRALQADEFVPYLQPVVRKGDYRWSGVEVLMRWQHPHEGLVRPDLFIPYAEHSGQIVPMTRALMQRTALGLAPYSTLLDDGFHIGINITADHCRDLRLLDDCRAFLQHFPPGRVRLTLELTERKLIEATPMTLELFEKLHDMGVMIALDDFGTGQSSLNYLRQFKVDYLKIDQSFVAMIGGDALSQHILDTIIELSSKLDLGLVAEGVETEAQRDWLAEHQVDFQQGYLYARPMPLDDFLKALAARPASARLPAGPPAEIMRG